MSEKMSSREIEDVLSSIRRLVTEDLRPANRAEPSAAPGSDKLLLTPSLRVVGGQTTREAEPDAAAPAEAVTAEAPPDDDPESEPWIDSIVAALGEVARSRPQEWEPELGDPAPMAVDVPVPQARIAPLRPAELRLANAAPGTGPVAPRRPEVDHKPVTSTGPTVLPFATPGWAQNPAEDAAQAPKPRVEPRRLDKDWAEAAEAEVRAKLEAEPVVERMGATKDEAALGQDVLQQMVREIIRDELSGPLGERITRNIRKMVHAEIARALAARDYE